jgi:hypothetical protein
MLPRSYHRRNTPGTQSSLFSQQSTSQDQVPLQFTLLSHLSLVHVAKTQSVYPGILIEKLVSVAFATLVKYLNIKWRC